MLPGELQVCLQPFRVLYPVFVFALAVLLPVLTTPHSRLSFVHLSTDHLSLKNTSLFSNNCRYTDLYNFQVFWVRVRTKCSALSLVFTLALLLRPPESHPVARPYLRVSFRKQKWVGQGDRLELPKNTSLDRLSPLT